MLHMPPGPGPAIVVYYVHVVCTMSNWCELRPIHSNQSVLSIYYGYVYIFHAASHLTACWSPTQPGSSSLHPSFFDTASVSQQRITLFDGCSQITCPMANQKLALTFDYKSTAKPPWGSERALATETKYERRIVRTTNHKSQIQTWVSVKKLSATEVHDRKTNRFLVQFRVKSNWFLDPRDP